jgi:hypothetical protein
MTQPIDALQMAREAEFEVYPDRNQQMHVWVEGVRITPDIHALISMVLERAATECEQSEAYRGSMFAQRIRAMKPVADKDEK